MATRRERVVLDVESNAVQKFAEAAAAAKLLSGELDSLSGRAVRSGKDLDRPSEGAEKVSSSARKAGPEIDRLSGRLRILADAAVTLGPALIPLGAATIPVLTGSLVGLAAAAGGIGTAVLAFNGLGDAIEAIDKYRLEPTVQNLAAMRQEAEKLGPAGAEFARYLANLEPELRALQNVARSGLFPGIEDGIDTLLTRGPQITRIISEIAQGMGDLSRDAGSALAGDDFDAFFNYLETDARPTLEAFARSVGNISLGLANMLVAFAPASRDFTGGLERMTKSFAEWSKTLDSNESFQSFVDYIRQSGPQAIDFLGAIAQAISGLLQAAAPLGSAVLPALTGLARVFAAIAQSPIGPGLYTAVAAFLAFNRAADVASRTMDRFKASSDKTASSMSKFSALSAGVAGTAIAVGALADNINRIDSENLDRSLTALGQGNETDTITKVIDSLSELTAFRNKIDLGEVVTLGGLAGDTSLDKFADNVNQVDQALAQMVESGNADQAADLFSRIQQLASSRGIDPSEVTSRFDAYALALDNAAGAAGNAEGDFNGLGASLGAAAGSARDLTSELTALNGFFDKRDAVRGYRDAIDGVAEGLKDGFSREDAANIDAVGRSILQVAEGIANPKKQATFLAGARAQLVEMAKTSGPEAAAVIDQIIRKFDDKRLTNPPPIKLSADDKAAEAAFARTRRSASEVNKLRARPEIGANDNPWKSIYGKTRRDVNSLDGMTGRPTLGARDQASGIIGQIIRALNGLDGKVATTYVRTIRQEFVNPQARANGGQVFGPGGPKDDKVPALLSNREFVQPVAAVEKYGVDFMESVRTLRFAEGGSPSGPVKGGGKAGTPPPMPWLAYFGAGVENAGKGLKGLKNALDKATEAQKKQTDAARDARDAAIGRRDALSSSIQQGLAANPWAEIAGSSATSGGNVWAAGAMAGTSGTGSMPATPASALAALQASTAKTRRFIAALNTLRQKGITGPVLQEIIGTGDVDRAEMMANLPIAELTQFSSAYTENQSALSAAGLAGGNAVEGANIAEANRALAQQVLELKQLQSNVRDVEKAIKQAEARADKSRKEAADKAADKTVEAASQPARNARRKARR